MFSRTGRWPVSILATAAVFCLAAWGPQPEARPAQNGPASVPPPSENAAADLSNTRALRDLADAVWASAVENSTYLRLQEGLPIERFEDLTLEAYHRDEEIAAGFRRRLAEIDASALEGDDLITYEILHIELADSGATDDDFWLRFDITAYVAPYTFRFAQQALAAQAIFNEAAAMHYLTLVGELADMIEQLEAKVGGQVERGLFLPRPALPSTRATWEGLRESLPAAIKVPDSRLQALAPEVRSAFTQSLDEMVKTRVTGGFDSLLRAIGKEYEKQAPGAVGLGQYPRGVEVYRRRIRSETTLDLSPEQIHQRGNAAVADIEARMAAVRRQLGFEGSAAEFIEQIRRDPRFIAQSAQEVEQRYMDYIQRIEPVLKGRPMDLRGKLSAEGGPTAGANA